MPHTRPERKMRARPGGSGHVYLDRDSDEHIQA
jgi:hypothetical protein